jgi:hypothetical protein
MVNMWIALIKNAKDVAIVEMILFFSEFESNGDSRNTTQIKVYCQHYVNHKQHE